VITLRTQACSGCATCAKLCPHGVLQMGAGQVTVAHEERCIECGACQLNCHDQAITVTKGTGCLIAIIRDDILKLNPQAGST
jgi:NAD-dependent dihydropyrimidine dehydrogenase PreA subunit